MKKHVLPVLFAFCMALTLLPQEVVAAENSMAKMTVQGEAATEGYMHSGSLDMDKLSKGEIVQLLQENSLDMPSELFEESPSYVAPYAAGKVKEEAIQVAVDRLNAFRRIAGLPSVEMDSTLNENAQYGAVLLATPGVAFGHYPSQPEDMDDDFYAQGYAATSSSNIAAGLSLSGSVDAFMDDSDSGNVSMLGHRRWQLNPTMGKVGFGYAYNTKSSYYRYVTEKVFDRSGQGCDYDFVAWPSSGYFPNSIFEGSTAWSVTVNPSKYGKPVMSELTVTLTRESDGRVWIFDGNSTYTASYSGEYFNVNGSGYGVSNCIIFRPAGISTYEGVYKVEIEGLKDTSGNAVDFAYQVEFFDEETALAEIKVEKVNAFVERMYTIALERASDPEGIAYWSECLLNHEIDGAAFSNGFIMSDEFMARGLTNEEYVTVLYSTFFDRDADAEGLAFWVQLLEQRHSRKAVLAGFVNSEEFDGLCTNAGIERGTLVANVDIIPDGIYDFVERTYLCSLGREGEEGGTEYWVQRIVEKMSRPEDVAKAFFLSEEYVDKNTSDEEYVRALYKTFMDREADEGGLTYWTGALSSDMTREGVLEGFAYSQEFSEIMASYGL